MYLVSLADMHVLAVLPVVLSGEHGVGRVVVVAQEALADVSGGQGAAGCLGSGSHTGFVELADREVLGSQMPVDVHGAQAGLPVWLGDRHAVTGVKITDVAGGHVGAGLLEHLDHTVAEALCVLEVVVLCGGIGVDRLVALTGVLAGQGTAMLGSQRDLLLDDIGHDLGDGRGAGGRSSRGLLNLDKDEDRQDGDDSEEEDGHGAHDHPLLVRPRRRGGGGLHLTVLKVGHDDRDAAALRNGALRTSVRGLVEITSYISPIPATVSRRWRSAGGPVPLQSTDWALGSTRRHLVESSPLRGPHACGTST